MTRIIDYSNNLNPRTSSPQNYAEMAKVYEGLKKLAIEDGVAIITSRQKLQGSEPINLTKTIKFFDYPRYKIRTIKSRNI